MQKDKSFVLLLFIIIIIIIIPFFFAFKNSSRSEQIHDFS